CRAVSSLGRFRERASAECGEQLLGGWVWLVPPGEPGADVAGELGGDLEGAHLRTAGEGEAGYQGDADTGADQGAHEAVVAGAAGDLKTETAEGGEHVGDIADIAPALNPSFASDLGQAGTRPNGQRVACGNQQSQRVGGERDIGASAGGGRPATRRRSRMEVVNERQIGSAVPDRPECL